MKMLLALLLFSFKPALAGPEFNSDDFKLLRLPDTETGDLVKWGRPVLGAPARVTYALLNHSLRPRITIGDCLSLESVSGLLEKNALTENDFAQEVADGLKLWESVSGIRFVRVADAEGADLVIGASSKNDRVTHARVGLELGPLAAENGVRALTKASLCLDSNESWSANPSHDTGQSPPLLSLKLIIAHEAGHVIGLNHPHNRKMMMHGSLQPEISTLKSGDIEAAVILYGR